MILDQIDRDNMLHMILAGRLSELRSYAKRIIALEGQRNTMKPGGPVMYSLPTIMGPRRDPLPEVVVLDQAAINDARDALSALEATTSRIDPNFDTANLACNWFREHIPEPPPKPITADGGLCMPMSPETP